LTKRVSFEVVSPLTRKTPPFRAALLFVEDDFSH